MADPQPDRVTHAARVPGDASTRRQHSVGTDLEIYQRSYAG
jgi:hypothetical protein